MVQIPLVIVFLCGFQWGILSHQEKPEEFFEEGYAGKMA